MPGALDRIINLPWKHPDFIDTLRGVLFRGPQYETKRQNLPTPGAGAEAYESYALPAFTPIGPGTHAIATRLHAFYGPPSWSDPVTVVAGIPRIAGQYILQPLLNPYAPESIHNPPQLFG
jgi:hypothetical protein